jgi:hypothetical protein
MFEPINVMQNVYARFKAKNLERQFEIYQNFAYFYNLDFAGIIDILKNAMVDKPFSAKTLEGMRPQHVDIVHKTLRRLTAGIYQREPKREVVEGSEEDSENLDVLLKESKFTYKIKQSLKRALFFNVVLARPVFRNGKIEIDIFTPDLFQVVTGNDYLIPEKVIIPIITKDSKGNDVLYFDTFTNDEYKRLDSNLNVIEKQSNPYKRIPFSVLRITEGIDFFGEPNWNLYNNQIELDIKKTDYDYGERLTVYPPVIAVNTGMKEGESLGAGKMLRVDNLGNDSQTPSFVVADISPNFRELRDSMDWQIEQTLSSEGIPSNSASTDTASMSGESKRIDEIELQEIRDDLLLPLYDFEIDLLNVMRLVANNENHYKIDENKDFEITFTEEKAYESVTDKKTRREMEMNIGYKDKVLITMEELEMTEEQAIEHLQSIAERGTNETTTQINRGLDSLI